MACCHEKDNGAYKLLYGLNVLCVLLGLAGVVGGILLLTDNGAIILRLCTVCVAVNWVWVATFAVILILALAGLAGQCIRSTKLMLAAATLITWVFFMAAAVTGLTVAVRNGYGESLLVQGYNTLRQTVPEQVCRAQGFAACDGWENLCPSGSPATTCTDCATLFPNIDYPTSSTITCRTKLQTFVNTYYIYLLAGGGSFIGLTLIMLALSCMARESLKKQRKQNFAEAE